MQFLENITPLLYGISPFAIGWILFSLVAGVRVGWEAGVRLFLLGLGWLIAISGIGVVLLFFPDWAAIILMLLVGFSPWVSTLRYWVASKFSGKLLMAVPANDESWSVSIMSGAFWVIFGLQSLISHNDFLTPAKSYTLGLSLILLGVFRAIRRIRYTQIREKGILYEFGSFYKWENIEGYIWKFGEDKLLLKLRKAIFNKNVNLKILSQFRQGVVNHLSQNVRTEESDTKSFSPVQKVN